MFTAAIIWMPNLHIQKTFYAKLLLPHILLTIEHTKFDWKRKKSFLGSSYLKDTCLLCYYYFFLFRKFDCVYNTHNGLYTCNGWLGINKVLWASGKTSEWWDDHDIINVFLDTRHILSCNITGKAVSYHEWLSFACSGLRDVGAVIRWVVIHLRHLCLVVVGEFLFVCTVIQKLSVRHFV